MDHSLSRGNGRGQRSQHDAAAKRADDSPTAERKYEFKGNSDITSGFGSSKTATGAL